MIKPIQFSLINYDCLSSQYKIVFPNVGANNYLIAKWIHKLGFTFQSPSHERA
jgi:hypothetical protein